MWGLLMKELRCHSLLSLLVVLAALTLYARVSNASCGDYLHHAAQFTPSAQQKSGDEKGPFRPTPCRGPHCSARTPVPATPAVPKLTTAGPRHSMYWLAQVPTDEVMGCWKLDEASDLKSLLIAGRLFRPPRIG
jgi:hypothetical protein